jgi:hypothetical protein
MEGKSEVVLPVLKHQIIKIYEVEVKLHVFLNPNTRWRYVPSLSDTFTPK